MEADASLIGPDGTVHLHAEAAVYAHRTGIVHPGHAEDNDALGFHHALQHLLVHHVGILDHIRHHAARHGHDGLMELRLSGIAQFELGAEALKVLFY